MRNALAWQCLLLLFVQPALGQSSTICFAPGAQQLQMTQIQGFGVLPTASGDFIGDGSTQVIFNGGILPPGSNYYGATPSPFRAVRVASDGTLSEVTSTLFPSAPTAVFSHTLISGDFDGSGRLSLYSSNFGRDGPPTPPPGARQSLFLSDGAGHLLDSSATLPNVISAVDAGGDFFAGDVRGVGAWDIVVPALLTHNDSIIAPGTNTVVDFNTNDQGYQVGAYVLRNDGHGNFSYDNSSLNAKAAYPFDRSVNPNVPYDFPGAMDSAALIDLTNRGLPDLIFGSAFESVAGAVYRNDGTGKFLADPILMPAGLLQPKTVTMRMVAADFNGTGLKDLVLEESDQNYNGIRLQYLRNRGDGTFSDETALRFPAQGTGNVGLINGMFLADLRNTGSLDIVLSGGSGVSTDTVVWLNDGTGHFTPLSRSAFASAMSPSGGPLLLNPGDNYAAPVDFGHTGVTSLLVIGGNGASAQLLKNCDTAVYPQNGWWWNPTEGGRGFSLERRGQNIFLAGFMYDSSGDPVWYVATLANIGTSRYQGSFTQYGGGQTLGGTFKAPTTSSQIGTVTLTFTDSSHGMFNFIDSTGAPGPVVPIQRFAFVSAGLTAPPMRSFEPQTGWWWNPAEGGRGYFIEIQRGTMFFATYLYADNGKPIWYLSQLSTASPTNGSGTLVQYGGGQALTGTYKQATVTNPNLGALNVRFTSPIAGTLTLPNGNQVPIQRYAF